MNKKVEKLKLITLIVVLAQLVFAVTFTIVYLVNAGNIQENFGVEYVALLFTILLIGDCSFLYVVLSNISKIKKNLDLNIEQLYMDDTSEAYLATKTGLVFVDKNGTVLWQSKYLYHLGIDIVEQNIFKWHKKFEDFLKGENVTKINLTIDKQTFQVSYLKTAGIFIFVEITELQDLNKYVRDQQSCIGIITIDNYSEIAGTTDERVDVLAKLREVIFDYGKKHSLLLRTLRNDAYFVVCNYKTLNEMIEDHFEVLEKAKEIDSEGPITPTLTIGFSYGYPDFNKLNEMAANAVEIAMSRGGDQAVVVKYGSDAVFYGGKSEITVKHTSVQIRSVGEAVMGIIEKSDNVYIMGHVDMDMDALGAALGIYEICASINKPAHIVYDAKLTERKTRGALASQFSMAELIQMVITPADALEKVTPSTCVVVVDVNRPNSTMCGELLEKTSRIIVLDHHRRSADNIIEKTLITYIDPAASSASEIVTELIKYSPSMNKVKLRPIVATFMMSGIFLDTGFFKNKTAGNRAFDACVVLKSFGADNILADELLKDEFEEYVFINKIMTTLKTPYYGVVYCVVEDEEIVEKTVLAKVASQCVNLKGISAAFTIGRVGEKEVGISARSDGSINVQILCEKLGGGGHYSSAATVIANATVKEVEAMLLEILELYLSQARNETKSKGN